MITIDKVTISFIDNIFKIVNNGCFKNLKDKILINVFFEASTRTSLSFESAMYRLDGKVITFQKDYSSLKKGESINDTIITLSTYGDIMVIRHPDINVVKQIEPLINIPIINAGNGNGEHPTQALLDLYTINKHLQKINLNHPITQLGSTNFFTNNKNIFKILFIGDILNSRTIHSLVKILLKFDNVDIDLLPYNNCRSSEVEEIINKKSLEKDEALFDNYHVIYITRFQTERTDLKINPDIIIDKKFLEKLKKNTIILHPLPRNKEINPEVDEDERCQYFKQMEYGVLIRKALLSYYLEE